MSSLNSNDVGVGFIAAIAVSGSVVLIARQVHKHLVSDFMKKIEFELIGSRRSASCQEKKRVRFAEDAMKPSTNNNNYNNNYDYHYNAKLMDAMPLNRQILYKGILEYRTLKGCNNLSSA